MSRTEEHGRTPIPGGGGGGGEKEEKEDDNDKKDKKQQPHSLIPPSSPGTLVTCNSSTGDDEEEEEDIDNQEHDGNSHKRIEEEEDILEGREVAVATTTMTTTSQPQLHQAQLQQQQHLPSLQQLQHQQERLDLELRRWSLATGTSLTVLLLSVVPLSVLALCLTSTSFLAMLLYKLYQRFILVEYHRRITHGPGIAPYLPDSIRHQLTHMSLHEWMMDDAFGKEYGYLLLYFLPGLSTQQLQEYFQRLTPRHQETLARRGLGHLLGPSFMNLIVGNGTGGSGSGSSGESRNDAGTLPVVLPPSSSSSSSSYSSASFQGHGSMAQNMTPRILQLLQGPGGEAERSPSSDTTTILTSTPPLPPATRGGVSSSAPGSSSSGNGNTTAVMVISRTPEEEENDNDQKKKGTVGPKDNNNDKVEKEEDLAQEGALVTDAVLDAMMNIYNMVYDIGLDTVTSVASNSILSVTRQIWRTASTVLVVSLGVGAIGWYTGVYENFPLSSPSTPRPSFLGGATRLPTIRLSYPSSSTVWSTTLASGMASVGLALVMTVMGSGGGRGNSGSSAAAASASVPNSFAAPTDKGTTKTTTEDDQGTKNQ
jgi:hypothetical protein